MILLWLVVGFAVAALVTIIASPYLFDLGGESSQNAGLGAVTTAGTAEPTNTSASPIGPTETGDIGVPAAGQTTPPPPPPGTPGQPSAASKTSSSVRLTWSASAGTVDGYQVQRCRGSGCSSFGNSATTTETSVTISGLSSDTTYRFRVRANSSTDYSGWSTPSSDVRTYASLPLPTLQAEDYGKSYDDFRYCSNAPGVRLGSPESSVTFNNLGNLPGGRYSVTVRGQDRDSSNPYVLISANGGSAKQVKLLGCTSATVTMQLREGTGNSIVISRSGSTAFIDWIEIRQS